MRLAQKILGFFAFITFCLGIVSMALYPGFPQLWLVAWSVAGIALIALVVWRWDVVVYLLFQRTTRYGMNLALVVFLILGIVAAANYLGFQYRKHWDLTRNKVHSLSEQTRKILEDLQEPVKLTYFYQMGDQTARSQKLLDLYRHGSKYITYEMVDLFGNPSLAKSMGVQDLETIVLAFKDNAQKRVVKVQGVSEEKITNGLIRLLKNQNQTVYFLQGHGERDLTQANLADGMSIAKEFIQDEVYTVKEIILDLNPKIPEDATVLVVASPVSALLPGEFRAITDWVKKGGKILLALDLDARKGGLTPGAKQFAEWLAKYGLQVHDKLLVDSSSQAVHMEAQVLLATADSATHVISKDFPRSSVKLQHVVHFFFPLTERLLVDTAAAKDVELNSLVKTSLNAWEESDWNEVRSGRVKFNPGVDYHGEMSLAYALDSKRKGEEFRAVVFGTSAFAINSFIKTKNNKDLLLNSLGWLANQESFISIRQQESSDTRITLDQNWLNLIFLAVVIALPVSIFGTGIWVWYGRRGR